MRQHRTSIDGVADTGGARPEANGEAVRPPLGRSQPRLDTATAAHRDGDEDRRRHPPLMDRDVEQGVIRELLENARAGMGGALVLRGDAGVGKSTLLEQAVLSAPEAQILRLAAAESEMAFSFAAVHQLVRPLLPALDRLPEPQRRALGVCFGMVSGPPADPFLVGLAVLTLLTDAAATRPVLCVMDDAQWLDGESIDVLAFVARRLLADRVVMLFAVRETAQPDPWMPGLPELRIAGLPKRAAGRLLEAVSGEPLDADVGEHIVTETGGNPLALLELGRELTPAQLVGRSPLPEPLPPGRRLEDQFRRRVRSLPPETQALLLLAAADQPAEPGRLWRAAAELGVPESAASAAEAADLAVFWPEVRFHHPLVRSAVYHAATATERRLAHRALAAACDSDMDVDVDRKTWHLAASTAGPDATIAAQVEAAAERERSRGGYSTVARLLERAASLTADPFRRAERLLLGAGAELSAGAVDRAGSLLAQATPRLRGPMSRAEATRLEGRIQLAVGQGAQAAATLLRAARELQPLDPRAARESLLAALEAVLYAGWLTHGPLLQEIARSAGELSAIEGVDVPPLDLLVDAYARRANAGYTAAVPAFRRAVDAFLGEDLGADVVLQRSLLAINAAAELADVVAVEALATRWVRLARDSGALTILPLALTIRSAFADVPCGRLADAAAAAAEGCELARATGSPRVAGAVGNGDLLTLVARGREDEARATAARLVRASTAATPIFAAYGLGILELSLGNYEAAAANLDKVCESDLPVIGTSALPDLAEAYARLGRREEADAAVRRYTERALATGTPLALGLLARSHALVADPGQARDRYQEAIELLAGSTARLELARAHLLYGEWLRRQRRRREARDQLRTAFNMFGAMGADGFAERARVELRATGERVGGREPWAPEELTPQEAQIATLVSQGEANRDIAARLFISPSTVEYHLRKVFRKLGVTSRTQLALRVLGDDASPSIPAPRT
jgi:DNA-binding CsgD family transcriptional regulator